MAHDRLGVALAEGFRQGRDIGHIDGVAHQKAGRGADRAAIGIADDAEAGVAPEAGLGDAFELGGRHAVGQGVDVAQVRRDAGLAGQAIVKIRRRAPGGQEVVGGHPRHVESQGEPRVGDDRISIGRRPCRAKADEGPVGAGPGSCACEAQGPAKRRPVGHGPVQDRHVEEGQRHIAEEGRDAATLVDGRARQPAYHQAEGVDQGRHIVRIGDDFASPVCRHC